MIIIQIGDLYKIRDIENSDWDGLIGLVEYINDDGEAFLFTIMHPYWHYIIRPSEEYKLTKV